MKLNFAADSVIVAVPIMGADILECEEQWAKAAASGADLVELRLDYGPNGLDQEQVGAFVTRMRAEYRLPVLATYRTVSDGGKAKFATSKEYRETVMACAQWADYVDVEVSQPGSARLIKDLVHTTDVVASFHDFSARPSMGITRQLLEHMQDRGACVAKVAWMVTDEGDVQMVQDMQQWAVSNISIPCVVIGMGPLGQPTRLGDSARISAFTFARGSMPSAPGQPTVEQIRDSISD